MVNLEDLKWRRDRGIFFTSRRRPKITRRLRISYTGSADQANIVAGQIKVDASARRSAKCDSPADGMECAQELRLSAARMRVTHGPPRRLPCSSRDAQWSGERPRHSSDEGRNRRARSQFSLAPHACTICRSVQRWRRKSHSNTSVDESNYNIMHLTRSC